MAKQQKTPLEKNETRMARWGEMTAEERKKIRDQEATAVKEAESGRKRTFGERASRGAARIDRLIYGDSPVSRQVFEDTDKALGEREKRYQHAKSASEKSDEARIRSGDLRSVDRTLKATDMDKPIFKKGGSVKKYAKGGSVGSASKRADGLAKKGKTKGRFV